MCNYAQLTEYYQSAASTYFVASIISSLLSNEPRLGMPLQGQCKRLTQRATSETSYAIRPRAVLRENAQQAAQGYTLAEDVLLLGSNWVVQYIHTSGEFYISSSRMVHLVYSGLYCTWTSGDGIISLSKMIQVRLSHQESRPSWECAYDCLVFSNYLDMGAGPGCGGHALGRYTRLCNELPEKMLSFNLCNIDIVARHMVLAFGKASPSSKGWIVCVS